MNKENKHNLSPEELFKLLDQKPGDAENLDDFEKEALEGFAMLGDKQQAMDSYQAVLTELSKKNSGREEERRKKPVLWLSIAAALLIILGLGIVWLMDNKEISGESIALNSPSPPAKEQMSSPAEETRAPDGSPQFITGKGTVPGQPAPKLMQEMESFKETDEAREKTVLGYTSDTPIAGDAEQKYLEPANSETSPVTAGTYEGVATEAKGDKLAESFDQDESKLLEKSKDKADKNISEEQNQVAVNDNVSSTVSQYSSPMPSSGNEGKAKANMEIDTKSAGKKREEKKEAYDDQNANGLADMSNAPVMKVTLAVPSADASLYDGGEKALHAYILKQAKERSAPVILKGKYEVKAQINADNTLKVISVMNTSKDCKDCAALIKSIIDKMKGWRLDNRSAPAAVSFELTF